MANENELNIRFKVNDDGSVVLDKIGQKISQVGNQADSMSSALNVIKWDALINIGTKIYNAAQQVYAFAEAGAKVKSVADSFELMARSAGVGIEGLISRLKQATDATIETSEMMMKATRLIAEGFSPDQIVSIGEAARVSSRLMGISVADAYNQVADSIVNVRERGLKTAGFVIDMDAAYSKHAKTLGVAKEDLNEYGKQMALMNAVAEKAAELHDKLGLSEETAFEEMQKSKSAAKEYWEELAKLTSIMWQWATARDAASKKPDYSMESQMYAAEAASAGIDRTAAAKFMAEEEHGGAARTAAFAPGKSQIDAAALLKKYAEDLKNFHEVDARLLKDQESTLQRMVVLQEKLNSSSDEAVKIAERMGVSTKASLTQWISQDIVGEYEKLLGSKLFSGEEMEQFKTKYIDALQAAESATGGWGSEWKQIEGAIQRINTMKVDDTQLEKTRKEFESLQKYTTYLDQFTGKIKLDDGQLEDAKKAIDEMRKKLVDLTSQAWQVNVNVTGTGSSQAPIMDKIAEIYGGFENMSAYIANMKANVEMSDINAQIAAVEQKLSATVNPPRSITGTIGSNYAETMWAQSRSGLLAEETSLKEQAKMLADAQTMAAAAPVSTSADTYGGGGGNISVNIGTINVNGATAAEVAADLDAQLADLYLRDRSKLKNAIEGSA